MVSTFAFSEFARYIAYIGKYGVDFLNWYTSVRQNLRLNTADALEYMIKNDPKLSPEEKSKRIKAIQEIELYKQTKDSYKTK